MFDFMVEKGEQEYVGNIGNNRKHKRVNRIV